MPAPEQIFTERIYSRYKAGIFEPQEFSPNFQLCSYMLRAVNGFFTLNSPALKIPKPNFYLIQSDDINGCAFSEGDHHFIGITKGLIDYSAFIFRNLLRDNQLFADILQPNSKQRPAAVHHEVFSSWASFCNKNNIEFEPLRYTPNNAERKVIAEALNQYFIYFIVLHEIGHLRQRNSHYLFEFDHENQHSDNLDNHVYEMDADLYAVNRLAEHLIHQYNERNITVNAPYLPFFEDPVMTARFTLFMLYFMFYFFSHNKSFEKYILEFDHPHPALRFRYSNELLLECFRINSFLSKDESLSCQKISIADFGNALKRNFPNSEYRKYFDLIKDSSLTDHFRALQNEAIKYKNLNGDYSY